jgi:MFS family permease
MHQNNEDHGRRPGSYLKRITQQIGVNRMVFALSMARLADALGNSILFIIIPLYVDYLPAPFIRFPEVVRVGVLIALYGLVNSFLQPFTGALSDRFGRRKLFIQIGLIVMGACTLLFILASSFSTLLFLRAFQGIGVALTVPASMALMAAGTQKDTRGGSMGIYTTMRMVGFSLGPLIGGFLQINFGFPAVFITGAGLVFLGVLLVQFLVNDIPSLETTPKKHRFRIIDPALIEMGLISVGIATFIMSAAFSMMTTLETQFNERLDQTVVGFSIAFSALMVSRLFFQIPLGRLSDRIGRKPLILAGLILMIPATALLGVVTSIYQLTGLRILQGIASAGIAAPAFALAADLAKRGGEGRQMGVITMSFALGIALGPLIAGILALVSFELPFLVGGLLALVGVLIVIRFTPETVPGRNKILPFKSPIKLSRHHDREEL